MIAKRLILIVFMVLAHAASASQANLVTKVNFELHNANTVALIYSPGYLNIPVTEDAYTNRVIISLPKVDWNQVKVPEQALGFIQHYTIDQSFPDKTNLILYLKDGSVFNAQSYNDSDGHVFAIKIAPSTTPTGARPQVYANAVNNMYAPPVPVEKPLEKPGDYAKIGDGLYVIAMAGRILGVNNQYHYNTSDGRSGYCTADLQAGLNGIVGYIGAGYGMKFKGPYYVGLEGFLGEIRNQNHYRFNQNTNITNQEVVIGFKYAVASRLGYYISPVALLYGKLGVSQNNFDVKGVGSNANVFFNQRKSFNVMGYQWGGGLEVALNNYVSGRIETYQTIYKQFSPSYPATNTAYGIISLSDIYKPRAQEMLLGIAVKSSALGGPMEHSQYEEIPSGIYGGVEAGVSGTDFRRDYKGVLGPTFPTAYKAPAASIKSALGVYGGYAHTLDRFYVAAEVQLEYNKSAVKEGVYIASNTVTEYANHYLGNSVALSTRLGYVFDNGTLGYGRIGVVRSRFKYNYGDSGLFTQGEEFSPNRACSKTLNGLRVGGGLEIALNRAMRLRGDYTLDIYPGFAFPGVGPNTREKIKITRNEVKLGLAYTFPVDK